jgi:hypothetical protein
MSMSDQAIHACECAICQRQSDEAVVVYHRQLNLLLSRLNEPQRRWQVGLLSLEPNSPSDEELSRISGLDEKTIRRGRRELEGELADVPSARQRRQGGGRPAAEKKM